MGWPARLTRRTLTWPALSGPGQDLLEALPVLRAIKQLFHGLGAGRRFWRGSPGSAAGPG